MADQERILREALQTATINANLALLPTFSDDSKTDRMTAKEWLQQVQNNKRGGTWTDVQAITYFRNALRGDMVQWYDSLTIIDSTALTWATLVTKFERDFRASPTVSLVISKLPEIKQQDGESVNKYFSRCAQILSDLKNRILIDDDPRLHYLGTQEVADAFNTLNEATRTQHNRAVKIAMSTLVFNHIAGYHIISGFKPSIRATLMQRDGNYHTLEAIKTEAQKLELKEEERGKQLKQPQQGTPIPGINLIQEQTTQEEIDAINRNWNQRSSQGRSSNQPRKSCTFCKKTGHTEEKCYSKHGRPHQGNNKNNQNKPAKCTYCNKTGHKVDKCHQLDKAEKLIQNKNKKSNKINEVEADSDEDNCDSKNC